MSATAQRPLMVQTLFDVLDSLPQVRKLVTQAVDGRRAGLALGLAPHGNLTKIVVRKPQSAREGTERRSGTLPVRALLDLSDRCDGYPGPFGEFLLIDGAFRHPVLDHLRDSSPIAHITLPTMA